MLGYQRVHIELYENLPLHVLRIANPIRQIKKQLSDVNTTSVVANLFTNYDY